MYHSVTSASALAWWHCTLRKSPLCSSQSRWDHSPAVPCWDSQLPPLPTSHHLDLHVTAGHHGWHTHTAVSSLTVLEESSCVGPILSALCAVCLLSCCHMALILHKVWHGLRKMHTQMQMYAGVGREKCSKSALPCQLVLVLSVLSVLSSPPRTVWFKCCLKQRNKTAWEAKQFQLIVGWAAQW